MKVELIGATNGLKNRKEMLAFGLRCARVCYSKKSWKELEGEPINRELLDNLIQSGHHSVFEHINLTFYLENLPKALAMVLNNEKQYATSEKSARYTVMTDIEPRQKELYEKWIQLLIPEIDQVYREKSKGEERENAVRKLAQENARYMTSVFTPTKMVYTVNLRQLNFLLQQFEAFVDAHSGGDDVFMSRLAESVKDFLEQTRELRIDGLDNQTDRSLSLFRPEGHREDDREPVDGEMYSRVYRISFACLAQAQRHRTISYTILGSIEKNADDLYIPPVVKKAGLEKEWVSDLKEVAKDDFPQAQLISVYERGRMEDFRSKALLRICGHAQLEVMYNTLETAQQLKEYQRRYGIHSLQPKCLQGIRCASPCVWLGGNALKRVV